MLEVAYTAPVVVQQVDVSVEVKKYMFGLIHCLTHYPLNMLFKQTTPVTMPWLLSVKRHNETKEDKPYNTCHKTASERGLCV
jgi:hypothetical protein